MPASPLHAAAIELIPTASIPTIRAILLMLLDAPAAAIPRTVRPPPLLPAAARLGRKHAARRILPNGADAEWEELRQQVRAGMTGQSLDYADLAAAVGCSASTMRVTLGRRQPASKRLITALRAWLETNGERAPEVVPAIPFRSRGGERRGNGGGAAESVAGVSAEA